MIEMALETSAEGGVLQNTYQWTKIIAEKNIAMEYDNN